MSTKKKSSKQVDKEGYGEGYRTGLNKGYKAGIKDAVRICQTLLDANGVHMAESEFYLEMQNMMEEGEIAPPDER